MKKTLFNVTLGLFMAASVSAKADLVDVPSGSFEGISTNLSFPLLSTVNHQIGDWTLQLSGVLAVLGSVKVGTAAAIGGPAPAAGTNEMGIILPVGVGVSATLSQTLTNAWLPNTTYTLNVALDPATDVNLLSGSTLALRSGNNNVVAVSGSVLVGLFTGGTGYKTIPLTIKTGATAPSGSIGIYLYTPSLATVGGSLYVDNFTLSITPSVVTFTTTSTNSVLTFNGSGGAPGQSFKLITNTNLLNPLATWSQLTTSVNQFDANGNFTLNVPVDLSIPCRFFRLVLQ